MVGTDTASPAACPHAGLFAPVDRPADAPDAVRAALRAAGPLVRVDAPAGGSAWVVTDATLARAALNDPRIVKDTALAPTDWDPERAGLEPPAAAQLSLTTADGATHASLRRAHAPLFTPRRMREYGPRADALALELLTAEADAARPAGVSDLTAGFTARFPATVVLDVVGAPLEHVEAVTTATHDWSSGDPRRTGAAMGAFLAAAAAALSDRGALADGRALGDGTPATRAGPHYCLGAALARVELLAAVRALRTGFPDARLAPGTRLRRVGPGGAVGEHLAELPVLLRG